MRDNQELETAGHQLNRFSNHQLKDVIAIAIAEIMPLENAQQAYLHSFDRKRYNLYVDKVGLSQYQMSDERVHGTLPFTQEEVETEIQEKISRVKAEHQAVFKEVHESWKKNSKVFYDQLQEEEPNQFLDWARGEVRKNNTTGCFSYFVVALLGGLFLLYFVVYWLYQYSITDYLDWITEPFRTLFSGTRMYKGYYFHTFIFFLGFLVLSGISAFVTMPLFEMFIGIPKETRLAKKKAQEVSRERYEQSKELLKEYHQKGFADFYHGHIIDQIIPSAVPRDYYNQLSDRVSTSFTAMMELNAWESSYPKESIETAFRLHRDVEVAITEYFNRFENGSSMLSIFPENYRNSEDLSIIWQLLNEGRADSWKESVNQMKQDQFQDSMLSEIRSVYQSMENLSSRIAYMGQELRGSLEFAIEQQQSQLDTLAISNRRQNQLLEQNNQLLEAQNTITSNLLIAELVSK